jgi:hypothetical protein
MRSHLSPLPPDLALLLSPSSVRSLLSRFAPSLVARIDPTDPFSIAEALCFRPVPAPLADALADLTRLATPVGREAILELLSPPPPPPPSTSTPTSPSPPPPSPLSRFPPVDLAVRLLCSRGLPRRHARSIRARALLRVARHLSPRPWLTLLWPRAELPASPTLLLDAALTVHGTDFVRGWIASLDSSVLRVIVVYRAPAERAVILSHRKLRARTVRPLACDVVRWDARDGRVSFSLARPALLTDWARAIGRGCARDPHAFSDRPAYTHKSLHDKGAAWLASVPLPAGVRKLDVVVCEGDDDGKVVRVRSDAALTHFHEATARARGYLRSTTIRFEVAGHDTPVDATIELPWKVLLSDGRFEEQLRAVMDAAEMHAPGALPDDLPSLAPMQPEWRWVDLLTPPLFARALERRALRRVRGKRPSGREHRRWGSLLRAFDLPGEDAAHVVGEDMAIRAFDAKPEALVWYAIDWARVVELLREGLALAETRVTDAPPGLLPLGEMATPGGKVVVFTLVRAVTERETVPLLKQLRQACGRATPALLVPRGRSLGGAVAEVALSPGEQLGVEDVAWVPGKIAEACGIGDDVEPWRFATEDAPLVLSVARGEAWYGRVRLLLTENQLAMLFALARAPGWMKSTELGLKITPDAGLPDQTVRKARQILGERLRLSFDEAKIPMPDGLADKLVEFERKKGYRLGVNAIVR